MNPTTIAEQAERIVGRRAKVAPPADAAPEDVRAHLRERQAALAQLRGQLDIVESEIAGVRAARILGEPVDATALVALDDRRAALEVEISEEGSIVAGLERRVAAWDEAQARRRYEVVRASNEALEAKALEMERQFERLILELSEVGQKVALNVREHTHGEREERRLASQLGGPARPRRALFAPPATLPSFIFRPPMSGVPTVAQWWREWLGNHRGFAGSGEVRKER